MRRVRWLWHRMASAMRLLFSLLVVALASAPSPAKAGVPPVGRRLTIVAVNDTHGAILEVAAPKWIASSTGSEIGGADWFGGYLEAIRADAKEHGGRGIDFVEGGAVAAEEADLLRSRGATVVVICAHAGPGPPENEIQRIAESVRGKVDAIASGHHHVSIGPPPLVVENVPIVQSGSKLQAFSVIELALDANGRVTSFAVNEGSLPRSGGPQAILHTYRGQPAQWRGRRIEPDARVAAILRSYDREVRALRETLGGETRVDLRKGSGNDLLGNLTSDALRSGAGGGLKAQFALQNAGGLRISEIPAGPITFGQIFDLYPFDNEQVVVSLRAIEVRNALEA